MKIPILFNIIFFVSAVRVIRIFKLIKQTKRGQRNTKAFVTAIKSTYNAFLLLVVCFGISAIVLGNSFFNFFKESCLMWI